MGKLLARFPIVKYDDTVNHLMGAQEVADLIGVTRQGVSHIAKTDPNFPEPVAVLAGGRVWERADIERWAREKGKIK
jgi:predicted DNA-binding transcriptional regulator AlpA